MKTKIVEVTNGKRNWGKFLLAAFTHEWAHPSSVLEGRLLPQIGWDVNQIWILDLQTCEGAAFTPGGLVSSDLEKHAVWVCPMYEPFLEYLWKLPREQVLSLEIPDLIDLPNAQFDFRGRRRPGPKNYVVEWIMSTGVSEVLWITDDLGLAQEMVAGRAGRKLEWKPHDSHGPCWTASAGHLKYAISEHAVHRK